MFAKINSEKGLSCDEGKRANNRSMLETDGGLDQRVRVEKQLLSMTGAGFEREMPIRKKSL